MTVDGKMLWFNEEKRYGELVTDDGERLPVAGADFAGEGAPVGRCAERRVRLTVSERDGRRVATDVLLVADVEPRRARSHRRTFG